MSGNQFRDFVHNAPPMPGQLGLTHVTDCAILPKLLKLGRLEPRLCKVFNEPLVYLFYGRPAYRRAWEHGTTTNLDYARICFILRDEVAERAHRIFPFDSGGFARYHVALHDSLTLDDFAVDPADHPRKVVGAFYDSPESYWTMAPAQPRTFPVTQNIVRSYYQLITGGLAQQFDDRCSTIEIQLADQLDLAGEVLAVIAPNQVFDDPEVQAIMARWGAEPRGYRLTRLFNPQEVAGRLFSEVERFLEDHRWL